MNKKGFVLTETIIVSVFIVTVFTFVFTSIFPLIGKYEDLTNREENVDVLYKLYNIRQMINNDTFKMDLLNMDIKRLSCSDFGNEDSCNTLMQYLGLENYILVYANGISDNLETLNSIDSEIAKYIEQYKTENRKTLILLDINSYTIGHIDMYEGNINAFVAINNNIYKAESKCTPTVIEDGVKYLSGNNDCINFNYVWYSGKMWRITAIYPDESIKMITENAITTIPFGNNNIFYENDNKKSYAYQWLTQDFLDTLTNYRNLLELNTTGTKMWNAAPASGNHLNGTNYVSSYVGLMNNYEYYKSFQNASGASQSFLNNTDGIAKESWHLLHPTTTDGINGYGIRPMVYLKPKAIFSSGIGTFDNPFTILDDLPKGKSGDFINTRVSGEYIKFKSQQDAPTYRIMSIEEMVGNKYAKIIANNYANNTTKRIAFGTTYGEANGGTPKNYWDYYLNNNFYSNLVSTNGDFFTNGIYYVGLANSSACYKESACLSCNPLIKVDNCAKTDERSFNVGLARFGELFATNLPTYELSKQGISRSDIWLITTFSVENKHRYIDSGGCAKEGNNSSKKSVRPTMYLKSSVRIISGSGTPTDPYLVEI